MKLLQTNARVERGRRERIAAALARLHRALPSYLPDAQPPSKHALLLEAADQLTRLRQLSVTDADTGRRLAELERQVTSLRRHNDQLSGQLARASRSRPTRQLDAAAGAGPAARPGAAAAASAPSAAAVAASSHPKTGTSDVCRRAAGPARSPPPPDAVADAAADAGRRALQPARALPTQGGAAAPDLSSVEPPAAAAVVSASAAGQPLKATESTESAVVWDGLGCRADRPPPAAAVAGALQTLSAPLLPPLVQAQLAALLSYPAVAVVAGPLLAAPRPLVRLLPRSPPPAAASLRGRSSGDAPPTVTCCCAAARAPTPTAGAAPVSVASSSSPSATSTQSIAVASPPSVSATSAQSLSTTSGQSLSTTSGQSLSTTSGQSLSTTSGQSLSSASVQSLSTTSGQSLSTTSAQFLSTTSAQSLSTTSGQSLSSATDGRPFGNVHSSAGPDAGSFVGGHLTAVDGGHCSVPSLTSTPSKSSSISARHHFTVEAISTSGVCSKATPAAVKQRRLDGSPAAISSQAHSAVGCRLRSAAERRVPFTWGRSGAASLQPRRRPPRHVPFYLRAPLRGSSPLSSRELTSAGLCRDEAGHKQMPKTQSLQVEFDPIVNPREARSVGGAVCTQSTAIATMSGHLGGEECTVEPSQADDAATARSSPVTAAPELIARGGHVRPQSGTVNSSAAVDAKCSDRLSPATHPVLALYPNAVFSSEPSAGQPVTSAVARTSADGIDPRALTSAENTAAQTASSSTAGRSSWVTCREAPASTSDASAPSLVHSGAGSSRPCVPKWDAAGREAVQTCATQPPATEAASVPSSAAISVGLETQSRALGSAVDAVVSVQSDGPEGSSGGPKWMRWCSQSRPPSLYSTAASSGPIIPTSAVACALPAHLPVPASSCSANASRQSQKTPTNCVSSAGSAMPASAWNLHQAVRTAAAVDAAGSPALCTPLGIVPSIVSTRNSPSVSTVAPLASAPRPVMTASTYPVASDARSTNSAPTSSVATSPAVMSGSVQSTSSSAQTPLVATSPAVASASAQSTSSSAHVATSAATLPARAQNTSSSVQTSLVATSPAVASASAQNTSSSAQATSVAAASPPAVSASSIYTVAGGGPRRSSVFCIDVLCSKESPDQGTSAPPAQTPTRPSICASGSVGPAAGRTRGSPATTVVGDTGTVAASISAYPATAARASHQPNARNREAVISSSHNVSCPSTSQASSMLSQRGSSVSEAAGFPVVKAGVATKCSRISPTVSSKGHIATISRSTVSSTSTVCSTAAAASSVATYSGALVTASNRNTNAGAAASAAPNAASLFGTYNYTNTSTSSAKATSSRPAPVTSKASCSSVGQPAAVAPAATVVAADHRQAAASLRRGSCEWREPPSQYVSGATGQQPAPPGWEAAQRTVVSPGRAPPPSAPLPKAASPRDAAAAAVRPRGFSDPAAVTSAAMPLPADTQQPYSQRVCRRQPSNGPLQTPASVHYQYQQPTPAHAPYSATDMAKPGYASYSQPHRPPPFYHCTSQVPNQTFYSSQAMYEPQYQPEQTYWPPAPAPAQQMALPPGGVNVNHKLSGRPLQQAAAPQLAQCPLPTFYQRPFDPQPGYYKPLPSAAAPAPVAPGQQKEAAAVQRSAAPQEVGREARAADAAGKEAAPQRRQAAALQQRQQHAQLQQLSRIPLPAQRHQAQMNPPAQAPCNTQSLFSVQHLVSSQQKKEPPRKEATAASKRKPEKQSAAAARAAVRKSKSSYSAEALLAPAELQRVDEFSDLYQLAGCGPQYLPLPAAAAPVVPAHPGGWAARAGAAADAAPALCGPPAPPAVVASGPAAPLPAAMSAAASQPSCAPTGRPGRRERWSGRAAAAGAEPPRRLDDLLLAPGGLFECQGALLPGATFTPPADDGLLLGNLLSRAEQPAALVTPTRPRAGADDADGARQCELWTPAGTAAAPLTSFSLSSLLPEIGTKVAPQAYPSAAAAVPAPAAPGRAALLGGEVRSLTTPDLPAHLLTGTQLGLSAPLPSLPSASSALASAHTPGVSSHQETEYKQ